MNRTTERHERQREATADLADAIVALPLGVSIERTSRADLIVRTPDGQRVEIAVKYLRSPASADVARLRRTGPSEPTTSVLVADRIVPRVRAELTNAGWGWFDRRGHLSLLAKGLLIDTDVSRLTAAEPARHAVETDVGLDVASALLVVPGRKRSVRELVAYTGRSLGAVHHAMRALRDEGLLGADGRPVTPDLFWEVSARWRPQRIPLAAPPDPSTDGAPRLRLGINPDDVENGSGWALTDTIAANAYGATAVVRGDHPPDFYVPDDRTVRIARQVLGDATTAGHRGATVAVAPVAWACRHRAAPRSGLWPAAHPVVIALDLSTDAGRGREILDDWSPPEPFDRVW